MTEILILFELECLFPLFQKDTFLGVLDTSGKLGIYWSEQDWDKPVEEKYRVPWKEIYLFIIPDSIFTVHDGDPLRFHFKPSVATRHYDNNLVEKLNILEGYYPGRVRRKGPWGEAFILGDEKPRSQITELESLLKELRDKTRGDIFELRYSPFGRNPGDWYWILMQIKYPNRPEAVHGSIANNPIDCVKQAIKRWDERSDENPW